MKNKFFIFLHILFSYHSQSNDEECTTSGFSNDSASYSSDNLTNSYAMPYFQCINCGYPFYFLNHSQPSSIYNEFIPRFDRLDRVYKFNGFTISNSEFQVNNTFSNISHENEITFSEIIKERLYEYFINKLKRRNRKMTDINFLSIVDLYINHYKDTPNKIIPMFLFTSFITNCFLSFTPEKISDCHFISKKTRDQSFNLADIAITLERYDSLILDFCDFFTTSESFKVLLSAFYFNFTNELTPGRNEFLICFDKFVKWDLAWFYLKKYL
ncbi:hypothetical protein TUBRATIS_21610 [Tubulinosema ratisbonensis]|uniref:Uncharacterized protein n=1 Tax=Tubulinosema ratisbonensis TaxID=291195 RepID=A0A437AJR1_9MICR|nr:hypothetical protein TUBRATIS_21610 [Tubulinosema ratisbonensis]